MTVADLLHLRGRLATQRRALRDRVAADAADTDRIVAAGFLPLLTDLHTAIEAVDAQLTELERGE